MMRRYGVQEGWGAAVMEPDLLWAAKGQWDRLCRRMGRNALMNRPLGQKAWVSADTNQAGFGGCPVWGQGAAGQKVGIHKLADLAEG